MVQGTFREFFDAQLALVQVEITDSVLTHTLKRATAQLPEDKKAGAVAGIELFKEASYAGLLRILEDNSRLNGETGQVVREVIEAAVSVLAKRPENQVLEQQGFDCVYG